jgi:hypothetical protein
MKAGPATTPASGTASREGGKGRRMTGCWRSRICCQIAGASEIYCMKSGWPTTAMIGGIWYLRVELTKMADPV